MLPVLGLSGAGCLVGWIGPVILDVSLSLFIVCLVQCPWIFMESFVYSLMGGLMIGLIVFSIPSEPFLGLSYLVIPLLSLIGGVSFYNRVRGRGFVARVRGVDYPVMLVTGMGNPSPVTVIWIDKIIVPIDSPMLDNYELIGILSHEEGHVRQKIVLLLYLFLVSGWMFSPGNALSYLSVLLSIPLMNWFREITADLYSVYKTGPRLMVSMKRLIKEMNWDNLPIRIKILLSLTHPPPQMRIYYLERFLRSRSST